MTWAPGVYFSLEHFMISPNFQHSGATGLKKQQSVPLSLHKANLNLFYCKNLLSGDLCITKLKCGVSHKLIFT